jgi:hypothetical protein
MLLHSTAPIRQNQETALQKHCKSTAKALQKHCKSTAKALQYR